MDSEASFEDRARQIGVSPDGIAALKRRSLNTFGKSAFLSAYQPGSADEGPLITALEEVLGARPDAANMASWRRLFFESHTLANVRPESALRAKRGRGM